MARFGEIGKQYFDDSGDPLISGKLYFYISGTTTPKTTYADSNLSIPNTNPVILSASGRQPSIFFNGSAKTVLTDQNDVQIEERDPDGEDITGNFDVWSSVTVYDASEIVVASDGNYYQSFTSNNQNNEPSASPTNWQQIEFIRIWNTSVSYSINDTVKASDGALYKSIVDSNVGNDPVSSAAQWTILTATNSVGDHEIYMTNPNGHGTTDLNIIGYSVTRRSVGTAITHAYTAENGSVFTIHRNGKYDIEVVDQAQVANQNLGISVNSNELTTNIKTINAAHRVALLNNISTSQSSYCAASGVTLSINDKVRIHDNRNTNTTDQTGWMRIVLKQAI